MASLGSRQVLRRGRKLVAFGLGTVITGLAGVWVAVGAEPGDDVAMYTALPLLLAGLGGGLVISPNQTLTLSQVPVRRAGSAGGVLQTGQRIGSAAGIAVTGSVFTPSWRARGATSRPPSATGSWSSSLSSRPRWRSRSRTR
jgi:hypothetical protein